MTAREELKRAQAAQASLEAARQASARGRALIEAIARQIDDLEATSMRAASSLATEMKSAIASGSAPAVAANDREMAKSDAARSALDARRRAAEQVVADFAAEESDREREVPDVTAAVDRAIQSVMLHEAEKIAAAWDEIDLKAKTIRARLGATPAFPIWRASRLSDSVGRAVNQNRQDREFDHPRSNAISAAWNAAALLGDANAQLTSSADDRVLAELDKESAERRARDDRLMAQLRSEPA